MAGALCGAFWAIYRPALSAPPVFDDYGQLIANRAIRYLFHPRIFWESEYTRGRPLPYLSFALSYWWGGLSLSGLRLWSFLLHLANAALLAALLRSWLRCASWRAPLAGASIFLLHPLAVDPVIYLSARGALLALCFVLLALCFHARERQGLLSWLGFLFSACAAFLSRESAAALLPLLFLSHRLTRRRWTEFPPYFGPLLLGAVFLLWRKISFLSASYRGFFLIQGEVELRSFAEYLRLSLSIWPELLRLFADPRALSIDHSLVPAPGWGSGPILLGLALWLLFALGVFAAWRQRSLLPGGLAWVFLSLLPTNSIFPNLDPLAERHLYIALPGLALSAAWFVARWRVAAAPVILLSLLTGTTLSSARVLTWRRPSTLWLDAHAKAPGKFRVAFNAANHLQADHGLSRSALQVLAETLTRLRPGAVRYEEQRDVIRFLAPLLRQEAEAAEMEPRALWRSLAPSAPRFWEELLLLELSFSRVRWALWDLQWESARAGLREEPVAERTGALGWVGNSLELLRAESLLRRGRSAEALALYERLLLPFGESHFPYWVEREALGDLYRQAGRDEEALSQYELAVAQYKMFKRFPPELHRKILELHLGRRDFLRASDSVGELLRLRSDDPEVRRRYAELLRLSGSRHATRQEAEARFYSESAVPPDSEREQLRP